MEKVEILLRMVQEDDYTIVADAIETARVSGWIIIKMFLAFASAKTSK